MPWLMVWDSLFCPTHRKYYSLKEKQRGLYLTKILGRGVLASWHVSLFSYHLNQFLLASLLSLLRKKKPTAKPT